jgi:glycosyltransferase involved in cell wall biosynthesis
LRGWRQAPGIVQRVRRSPGYLGAFKRWLEQESPDVVHVNSLQMLPEATLARRLGLPIVIQVHEIPSPGWKRDLTVRWAAAIADVLVGVSQPVADMLAVHARDTTPVMRIHNGVPRVDARPVPKGTFIVGTIGHVSRTKGTDVFLQAASLALETHPDICFEHVGPTRPWGDDEYEGEVEALANSPALRDSVTMLGHQPAGDAYTRWSVFVLSSRQEGFPLSTLEAMASGVPVIATRVGGIPEQIVHLAHGILVPPDDAAAVAGWIRRLHDDPDLQARLGTDGRAKTRARFTLESQADELNRAYEKAIGRRK